MSVSGIFSQETSACLLRCKKCRNKPRIRQAIAGTCTEKALPDIVHQFWKQASASTKPTTFFFQQWMTVDVTSECDHVQVVGLRRIPCTSVYFHLGVGIRSTDSGYASAIFVCRMVEVLLYVHRNRRFHRDFHTAPELWVRSSPSVGRIPGFHPLLAWCIWHGDRNCTETSIGIALPGNKCLKFGLKFVRGLLWRFFSWLPFIADPTKRVFCHCSIRILFSTSSG